MIALIAVAAAVYAIDKPYSYQIPPSMSLHPGVRVMVPFGKGNRRSEGVVLEVSSASSQGLKPVYSVLDEEPVVSPEFLRLAAFLRERYFCTYYDAIKTMLPAGLWFQEERTVTLTAAEAVPDLPEKQVIARQVLQILRDLGGTCSMSELNGVADEESLNRALSYLKQKKLISYHSEFSKKVQDKTEKVVSLAVPAEQAMEYVQKKQRSSPLQCEVLKLLCAVGSGSAKELSYLTGANGSTMRRLQTLGLVEISAREVFRTSLPDCVEPAGPIVLNEEQQVAYEALAAKSRQNKPGVSLLYGVTGSGKTSVYLKLIQDTLDRGRTALLLVPEIALTPQLIETLMAHFGSTVAVLHSALRVTERYDAWKRIRQGGAGVVIGTRSAVFAPLPRLGLVILDEEQEHTYKSENTPRYHAREVAIYRGSKEQALVVLGSATPSVETMYQAQKGVYSLHRLTRRYNGKQMPEVEIIDLKQEIRSGNSKSLSEPLQLAIEQVRQEGKQSILFLNRRGASRCIICVECGHVPHCPRCSVSLTYHQANQRLMCHYCGYSQPILRQCPQCGGTMKQVGIGTQKVEQELKELHPEMPVLRMDADTVTASNNHEAILRRFQEEKIPVLIGTQMVTKGLNFEQVVLVGVVDADMSLYVNHYRAAETTFSMLTQVIGRSGRGSHPGKAIIQTMTPEHTVIQLAAQQDYDRFFELELSMRKLQQCPPFADLFTVLFSGPMEQMVIAGAYDFKARIEAACRMPEYQNLKLQVLGPSPAAVAMINCIFRYRLTIRCENTRSVRLLLGHLLKEFSKNKKNKGISAWVDINSYE